MKALISLRERLGLPPPSKEDVLRLKRDVEDILKTVPVVRQWRDGCRNIVDKDNCQRDVFGECNRCDRRRF